MLVESRLYNNFYPLEILNSLQMDSDEKARRADFVIDTKMSEFSVFRKVKEIMHNVRSKDAGDSI